MRSPRRRGDTSSPSSSSRALTEALNLGSGTSSSELSPGEYCLATEELVRKADEFWNSGEVRLDPERESAVRDISRV